MSQRPEDQVSAPAAVALFGIAVVVGWAMVQAIFLPDNAVIGGELMDVAAVVVCVGCLVVAGIMWLVEHASR